MRDRRKTKNPDIFVCIIKEARSKVRRPGWQGYRYPHQIKKSIWIGKLSDPDFHTPSCPHLHSEDGKEKLDVYTGEFYNVQTRSYTGKYIDDKVIKDLWADSKFIEFANRARKLALTKYPGIRLPLIPKFDNCALTLNNRSIRISTFFVKIKSFMQR